VTHQFWLISKPNSIWHRRLHKTIGTFGEITVAADLDDSVYANNLNKPQIIIIDARNTKHTAQMVTRAVSVNRRSPVLVVGSSKPIWQDAREMFRAGAKDYIPSSVTDVELREILENMMNSIAKFDYEEVI